MNFDTQATASVNGTKERALGELRETIDTAMGSIFFGPLLSSMRSSSIKGTVGHGGRGEEIFQAQLDQVFAERAGTATNYDIADALFDRFARAASAVRE